MKIAIIGSRSIAAEGNDKEKALVTKTIYDFLNEEGIVHPVIISGGAKGVDTVAHEYAEEHELDFILIKPYHLIDNKVEYMPRFFFTRNKQIVDNSDMVIAFWDGASNGTKHAIEYARKRGKPVHVVIPGAED